MAPYLTAAAKAWYFPRFYDFQPDLNTSNPEVQAEMLKTMGLVASHILKF